MGILAALAPGVQQFLSSSRRTYGLGRACGRDGRHKIRGEAAVIAQPKKPDFLLLRKRSHYRPLSGGEGRPSMR
jgi:hypothetical protein